MRRGTALKPALVWFRNDLRLLDNPALARAVATGRPLLLLYVLKEGRESIRPSGGAARWWLSRSLKALSGAIGRCGGRLILRRGDGRIIVPALAREAGAELVVWNRRYEAAGAALDADIKADLQTSGIAAECFVGNLLREPWELKTQSGDPYRVFTPFWRAHRGLGPVRGLVQAPAHLADDIPSLASDELADWKLEPSRPNWAAGFEENWKPGEAGAAEQLAFFMAESLPDYAEERDRPDRASTSRLSPHLRFGEISPVQILHALEARRGGDADANPAKFLSEIGWREFSYHLLFHWPQMPSINFQPRFDRFSWRTDRKALRAWQRGLTGYPIVDAGMRQLWRTGWMHNRVRLVVASFLAKHLLIDWREGESWFWDTLVDADVANNPANWQWVAGTGADAAPYFRVFNPVLQGQKFDPGGAYVRRWVPELAAVPAPAIHAPWAAKASVLKEADVALGTDYPRPIVDHDVARGAALEAFQAISGTERHEHGQCE